MTLSQATSIVIVAVIFSVLPMLAVALRFYARSLQPTKLAWDDWLIVPGLMFTVGLNVTVVIGVFVANLGGHKTPETSPETLITYNKASLAIEMLNNTAVIFVKSSIVMFYYRIFQEQGRLLIMIIWALLGLIILRCAFFVTIMLKCVPMQKIWLPHTVGRDGCLPYITIFHVSAISNAITDFLILMVPIPFVWQMRLPLRKRIAVIGIFLLGGFTCIAAVLRIYFFQSVGNKIEHGLKDTTYEEAPVFYWTAMENSIAVICACLPLMRTIVVKSPLRSWAGRLLTKSPRRSPGSSVGGAFTPPSIEVVECAPRKLGLKEFP